MDAKDIRNLVMLSLVCILLAELKAPALIQYWQQSRHIFLQIDTQVWKQSAPWKYIQNEKLEKQFDQLIYESNKRMVFAGQIILNGTDAIPKPAPQIVKEIVKAKCPVAVKPACPASVQPTEITPASAASQPEQKIKPRLEEKHPADQIALQESSKENIAREIENDPAIFSLQKGEKILLIGDSMMQGVAPHIAYLMRKKHSVESLDMGTKSTGLTYPSFFDWPAHVEEEFTKEHYAALVVLLGANDTWDMVQNNRYVKFASDLWRQLYIERIEKILLAAESRHIKVIWLSAPPMGREDIADRIPVLNEIIEQTLQKHSGSVRFVNSATSLTADGKTFTRFIDVPERGSVMVRADDGVHFTPYGEELLAKLVISQFTFAPLVTSQLSTP